VLLSINIPEQELIVNFIQNSLPQTPQLFCIAQYPNGAIYVQTKTGEHTDAEADSLLQFITKGTSGWYALSETPFSTMQQIGQTSLEMELERDYLLIKGITGTNCNLHLLIQLKPYGITKEKYLLAGQKKQFEVSIKGFITSLLALMNTDRAILKNIAKVGIISKNDIIGDFYDLIPSSKSGRKSNDEITIFKNGGGAHLDLMIAKYLIEISNNSIS
jgi:hypothetical protein